MTYQTKLSYFTQEIGKAILMNGSFTVNEGLLTGQIGAAIFLYNYESHLDEEIYYDYANDLTMSVLSKIRDHKPGNEYSGGLSGIGLGISYLIKKDYIEAGEDFDVLNDIDHYLLKHYSSPALNLESIGTSVYFLSGLKHPAKNENELERLLKEEVLIDHIDVLDDLNLLSDLMDPTAFFDQLNRNNGTDFFIELIEKLSNSAQLLYEMVDMEIYPELKNKIVYESYLALEVYLKHFFQLIKEEHVVVKEEFHVVEYLFFKLYYSFLKMALRLDRDRLETDFIVALMILDRSRVSYSGWKESKLDKRIPLLIYLSGITALSEDPMIAGQLKRELESLLDHYLTEGLDLSSFLLSNGSLNLGLSGLSGLGMVLIDQLYPRSVNWNENIFVC